MNVGITGNTGSDLDVVTSMIDKYYDVPVFDADLALKFKLLYCPKGREKIINIFGADRLGSESYKNGLLNLERFKDQSMYEILISLFSEEITKKFLTWRYSKHNTDKIVLFKSMILMEHGFDKSMDYNISVYKPKSMRVNETRNEKFLPSSIVNKIFNSEMGDEYKNRKSNYTIHNYEPYTISVRTLTEQVSSIIEHLERKSKSKETQWDF